MRKITRKKLSFLILTGVLGAAMPVYAGDSTESETEATAIEALDSTRTVDALAAADAAEAEDAEAAADAAGAEDDDAAGTEDAVLNWSDLEEEFKKLDLDGEFVTLEEVPVKFWLPSMLIPDELTKEDKKNGYVGYYESEDKQAVLSIMYIDCDGITWEEYAGLIDEDDDFSDITYCLLNGLDTVTYRNLILDENFVTVVTEDGHVLEFTFWPVSNEAYYPLAQVTAASIQPE